MDPFCGPGSGGPPVFVPLRFPAISQVENENIMSKNVSKEDLQRSAIRKIYVGTAVFSACQAISLPDLKGWWLEESERRLKHGIVKGTPEYDEIVNACNVMKDELSNSSVEAYLIGKEAA